MKNFIGFDATAVQESSLDQWPLSVQCCGSKAAGRIRLAGFVRLSLGHPSLASLRMALGVSEAVAIEQGLRSQRRT